MSQGATGGKRVTMTQSPIIAQIVDALLPVVLAVVALAGAKLTAYLHSKGKESKVAEAFAVASEFFMASFAKLRAELEPDIKAALADGKIDDAERAAMVAKLVEVAKSQLPAGIVLVLKSVLGSGLETWLQGKAQQAVDVAVSQANPK